MGDIIPLRFAVQSNPGAYHHDGPLRLINGYVESRGAEGKGQPIHYAIPGLQAWKTLDYGGPGQGLIEVDGLLYVVANRAVYKIDAAETVTYLGGFLGDGPLTLSRIGQDVPQVVLCAGGAVSVIETGLVPLISASLPGVVGAAVVSNYCFYALPDGTIVASDLLDATSIDALSVATASSSPDGLIRPFSFGDTLVLFGPSSIEFWSDVGGDPFPFAPVSGTAQRIGLIAAGSVAEVPTPQGGMAMMWAASDFTVRMATGYTGANVAIKGVSEAIRDTADKSQITATVQVIPEHVFYVLSGPDWTWAYDVSAGLWHERQSYGSSRSRVAHYATWRGQTIALDATTGALYKVRQDVHDEAGNHLVWSVRGLLQAYPERLTCHQLWLDVIPGQGLNTTTDHNADPKVMVRWSRDNGVTWGPIRALSAGRIGESKRRVVTRKLGTSLEDGFVVEASMSAAVVKGLTGAAADATKVRA